MLANDCITNLLDLQNVLITKTEATKSLLSISLETKKSIQACPCCNHKTSFVYDYRIQKINDIPLRKKKTILLLKKRRYICKVCGKRFYEHYDFLSHYKHSTNRVYGSIIDSLKDNVTCKTVAREHNVSDNTVIRCLKGISFSSKPILPEILGIDEFKGNSTSDKYQVQITDISNRKTLDILPTRQKVYLINYFSKFNYEERCKVKYIVMDMWDTYKNLKIYFPKAEIVIDRFHYDRQVYWALDRVRKRIQKNLSQDKRIFFKHSKYLFHKRYSKLTMEEQLTLQTMLSKSDELYDAWVLKERYVALHDKGKVERNELKEWLKDVKEYAPKEFKDCIRAFNNWFHYILDSFGSKYTNAYTEGKHNFIKVIKRTAYGFRNFANFRKRILLST